MQKSTIIPTLNVSDLSIGFMSKQSSNILFNDISFKLNKAELVGIIGPNGIGKSTLIRTLSGVQSHLAGSIEIKQKNLKQFNPLELASELSVVLTEALATRTLSVFEIVALGRQPYTNWIGQLSSLDLNIIEKAMAITQIDDLKYRKSFELSDGQMQRVMIARALAQDTDLIILDEPTTHLDLNHKARTLSLLKKLCKEEGKSILFSTHEIELAIQLCDKLVVMLAEKVYFDSPDKLISSGVFSKMFPSETIEFDTQMGSFRIKK
ncbi:MAG: ABC transporter ATP-binding protein [Flavobacteriaceae bacterium]|nr:ABC transporter ATP-binding protein [Flavobacteriaceae bacterium]